MRWTVAYLTAGLLAAAGSAQSMEELHPDGVYTQAPTGMSYPLAVDGFQRVSVIRYKPDGTDESAGYVLPTPTKEVSATVYVFRSPDLFSLGSPQSVIDEARAHLCEGQFRGIEQEVLSAHPDAKLASEGETSLDQGGASRPGWRASYDLVNAKYFGRADVASRSEAYLFCFAGGKWSVEYRIDYPAAYDAGADIAQFMRDLTWTIPPEK
jgi:hypothetical protein